MRAFRCLVLVLAFVGASAFVSDAVKFKIYEVKEGDTLWTISENFYGTPYYWYFIWEANKTKVKNPHWIYPGQDLKIPPREWINKQLGVERVEKPKKPLLHWEQQVFIHYITKNFPPRFGVLESDIYDKDKTLFSQGDTVGFKILDQSKVKPGRVYLVYRVGERVKDPYSGKDLGYYVSNIGLIKVMKIVNGHAMGRVVKTTSSLMSGDAVTAFEMPEPIYEFKDAKGNISARIVSVVEDKAAADLLDFVFLNVGKESHLKPGDVLYAYQEPYNVKLARLMVLKVTEDATTCIVGKVKRILMVGDKVTTKERLK